MLIRGLTLAKITCNVRIACYASNVCYTGNTCYTSNAHATRIGARAQLSIGRRGCFYWHTCYCFILLCLILLCLILLCLIPKGYRDAQCAWTNDVATSTPPEPIIPSPGFDFASPLAALSSPAPAPRASLVIYAPRRGLLEVWRAPYGARIHAFSVGGGCLLLTPPPPLLAKEAVQANHQDGGGGGGGRVGVCRPQPEHGRCFVVQPSGALLAVAIPHSCAEPIPQKAPQAARIATATTETTRETGSPLKGQPRGDSQQPQGSPSRACPPLTTVTCSPGRGPAGSPARSPRVTSCQEDKRPGTPELSDLVRNITDQLPNLSLPESWSQIQPQPQPQSTVATEAAASPQLSNVYTHAVSSDPSPSSHSAIGSALPPTSLLDPAVPTQLDPDGSPSADRIPKPQPGLAASPSDTSQLNSDLMQRDAVAGAQSVDREVDGTGADEDGADGNGADEDGAVGTDADEDGADGDLLMWQREQMGKEPEDGMPTRGSLVHSRWIPMN